MARPNAKKKITTEINDFSVPSVLRHPTYSEIIREKQGWLQRRKDVRARDLVPAHVHEIYAQIWRGEELVRQERAKKERSWFRRLLARFA